MSEEDRHAGFALFCCAKAKSDLDIEVRELRSSSDLPVKTLPARVQKMTLAAPDVMIVELKLPASERLQFLPGQYIEILLKERRRRAFSLANAPHDDASLQLHIRHVPGGFYTDRRFSAMKERDILRINGPHGSFYLREDSTSRACSSPAAPVLPRSKPSSNTPLQKELHAAMAIYWGGLSRADLYPLPLAESWVREHANIRFIPVLSDAPKSDEWHGRAGFVHVAAMQDWPDLSGHQVYVCGSPAMVAAARRDFVGQCQLPESEFFADSFEFANDAVGERSPTTTES